jgi:hypothetical protein
MDSKKQSKIELMAREALDVEVRRVMPEKLHPHGSDVVVHPVGHGITHFVSRVRGGEVRIQSRLEFLPIHQLVNSKRRRPDV